MVCLFLCLSVIFFIFTKHLHIQQKTEICLKKYDLLSENKKHQLLYKINSKLFETRYLTFDFAYARKRSGDPNFSFTDTQPPKPKPVI